MARARRWKKYASNPNKDCIASACLHSSSLVKYHAVANNCCLQVIEFLSQDHPPPVNWRSALKQSPLEFDKALLNPPAARLPRAVTAPQAERTFAVSILPNAAAIALGYGADAPCLLRVNAAHITLVDQITHRNAAGWPMAAVEG